MTRKIKDSNGRAALRLTEEKNCFGQEEWPFYDNDTIEALSEEWDIGPADWYSSGDGVRVRPGLYHKRKGA